jgi:hypothetical protein
LLDAAALALIRGTLTAPATSACRQRAADRVPGANQVR